MQSGALDGDGRPNLSFFRPGIYLHYKGHLYEATHLVHDANDPNRVAVHYVSLQLNGAHEGPRHAIRTWQDWYAHVHRDGHECRRTTTTMCPDTKEHVIPRFRYLGPAFQAVMADPDYIRSYLWKAH